jgi:ribose-phosphate pyrophosphokinase
MADLLESRFERIICVDLHNPAIEGFFAIPMLHLSAVSLLSETLQPRTDAPAVLVAPDLGAVKLVERYAEKLSLPAAYIHKKRHGGSDVQMRRIVGEVAGRRPVIVDDMISTGGTIVSAVRELLERGCRPPVTVAVTHALLSGNAMENLSRLPIRQIVTTDSLPAPDNSEPEPVIRRQSLARLLAEAIEHARGALQG